MTSQGSVALTAAQLSQLMAEIFPQVAEDFVIEEVAPMRGVMRMKVQEKHLRPGGTVSGPSMFGLADCAMYVAVMSMIGPEALSVTTNCSIDFMRKPVANADLIATTRLLKLGKLLAVGDVLIQSEGAPDVVARASLTYAIPPRK